MANTGMNISKYLGWPGSGNQGSRNTGLLSRDTGSTSYPSTTSSTGSYNITGDSTSSIKRILAFVLAIIIVMIILLLFVDKYITPIFRSQSGSPGIVTLPWTDTGVLFWKRNSETIKNEVTPIQNKFFDYSFIVDIFIENPIYFTNQPRILVSRGGMPIDTSASTPTTDRTTLLSVLQYYNFVVALLPDTTDMIVSVLNQNHIMENIIIPNITVQSPFRLGVVIMDKAFEVYIDGRLMKTRSYGAPLLDVRGDIVAGSTNVAKLRTLKIWDRALIAPEIREAKPPLTAASIFGADPIPGSSICTD
jgi:hypothetical protein